MTDMNIIERVARAIRAQIRGIPDDGSPVAGDGEDGIGRYDEIARAAIEALREPSDKMIEAAWASAHDEDAKGVWSAMIDAAISDGQ